jgi:acetyltransferase-like isoleucine patch superfamily enzyme
MNWKIKIKIQALLRNILVGDITYKNCRVDTSYPELIFIGKNFIAAPGSAITAHDSCLLNKGGVMLTKKVVIGDNVYLGANSVILPGVILGDNVIVSACSLVTKSFPSNVLIGGNPAKVLMTTDEYKKFCKVKYMLNEFT